ncbi:DUF4129 domain-containing protein [Kitasatospora sp. NPDC058965]|uniref:DUF4129 domain-containing protein n=1 Tax=Kitasatospora sp. NPDC058965 TaxID=3346682 RepID=UPI00368F51BC
MTAPQEPRGGHEQRAEALLRPALAGLAVAGLATAALLLRPSTGLVSSATDPLVGTFLPLLLLTVGWGAALHHLVQRFRARAAGAAPSPRAERLAEATRRLLLLAGPLVPVALFVLFATRHRSTPPDGSRLHRVDPEQFGSTPSVQPQPLDDTADQPHPQHLPALVGPVLLGLLLLAALVVAVLVLRQLRHRVRPARPVAAPPGDLAEQLVEAVELGRRALTGSDARAAVIACYAAMEDSLADSGVARRIADSPTDLLERAVAAGTVRRSDAGALTALFREARFSRHPMGGPELSRARAALDSIAAHLAARRAEPVR